MGCIVPQLVKEVIMVILDALSILQVLADGIPQDVSLNRPMDSALDQHQQLLFVSNERKER